MAQPAILIQPEEVVPALRRMELEYHSLIEAIQYADNEKALCTAHDPKGFDLIVMNAKMARALRDTYVGERWSIDDTSNQPGIRNPHLKLRIIPCNFDANAGNHLADPTNFREKGTASATKTTCNSTLWFPGMAPEEVPQDDEYQTYVLGTHVDSDGVLRAELSKPLDFASGKFTKFDPRIILLDGSSPNGIMSDTSSDDSGNGSTEIIDIAVKRK